MPYTFFKRSFGTSPLYAVRECFHGEYGIAASPANVLGVLSLMFWSLIMIVTFKYLIFVLRADTQGEGGVMALTALIKSATGPVKNSRLTWIVLVFPALVLNYFGQGALLLTRTEETHHPFYALVPSWAMIPMVVLATLATIIASQAVITGSFSLTRQAIQLGYLPRLRITHTSASHIGQIYVGPVNWLQQDFSRRMLSACNRRTYLYANVDLGAGPQDNGRSNSKTHTIV